MDIKDKVVVITGSSKGIGKEMAKILISKGAKVVINGRSADETTKTAQELDAYAVAGDVTNESDVSNLAEKTVQKFGRIDVWINNAGIWLAPSSIEDVNISDFRKMLEVNLFGTVYGCKIALRYIRQNGKGAIVNIISSAALKGRAEISAYSSSKFAADGFTKAVRAEVQERKENIEVINVYPGGTKTDLFNVAKPNRYPTFMEPSRVAGLIVENLEKEKPEDTLIIIAQK